MCSTSNLIKASNLWSWFSVYNLQDSWSTREREKSLKGTLRFNRSQLIKWRQHFLSSTHDQKNCLRWRQTQSASGSRSQMDKPHIVTRPRSDIRCKLPVSNTQRRNGIFERGILCPTQSVFSSLIGTNKVTFRLVELLKFHDASMCTRPTDTQTEKGLIRSMTSFVLHRSVHRKLLDSVIQTNDRRFLNLTTLKITPFDWNQTLNASLFFAQSGHADLSLMSFGVNVPLSAHAVLSISLFIGSPLMRPRSLSSRH